MISTESEMWAISGLISAKGAKPYMFSSTRPMLERKNTDPRILVD